MLATRQTSVSGPNEVSAAWILAFARGTVKPSVKTKTATSIGAEGRPHVERKQPSPVRIVEALYDFSLPVDRWLAAVGDELRPILNANKTGLIYGSYQCADPYSFRVIDWRTEGVCAAVEKLFSDGGADQTPVFVSESVLSRSWYCGAELAGWATIKAVRSGQLNGLGLADMFAINAIEPDGSGCSFASFQVQRTQLTDEERMLLAMIGRHLSAVHRLRQRFPSTRALLAAAQATFDPGGRDFDAHAAAADPAHLSSLRAAVKTMDAVRCRRPRRDPLASVASWRSLVDGRWTLVDHFDADGRRYVLAIDNRPEPPSPRLWSKREREVVLQAVSGHDNKTIAANLGVAHSTVRVLVQRAATKIGASSRRELVERAAKYFDGADGSKQSR